MKTAISMDDELLREADRAARAMHLSRSALFAAAITEYLRQRRNAE
ncbi:MAG: ribbon-helix-helix protein, CopG family, partial [Acidobacteriia bacterium]|nr:ribbon-helix-helix protein, CopG family [Terriglobia bacterium]